MLGALIVKSNKHQQLSQVITIKEFLGVKSKIFLLSMEI